MGAGDSRGWGGVSPQDPENTAPLELPLSIDLMPEFLARGSSRAGVLL